MIDAILFSVRDNVRSAGFGYGVPECDIRDDGRPPPKCGNIFVAISEGISQSKAKRNLDEYFSFAVTLTMRVSVPLDRVGDMLMASKLARTSGKGNPSFNSRMEQLRGFLHMNWNICVVTGQTPNSANDNIAAWTPGNGIVYGFVELAAYSGRDKPELVGGDWFGGNPDSPDVGLKCEMRFDGARRMQPQTSAVGPFG